MLRIAVCDDDEQARELVKSYVQRLATEEHIPAFVLTFEGGSGLLSHYPEKLDLLFLDVQMPGINGIETAKELRRLDREVTLIFMTNFAQYAIEGYSVQAYQYLLKPVSYARFQKELRDIFLQRSRLKGENFSIKNDQGVFQISVKRILYVETAESKNVLIHLEEGTVTAYLSLRQIQEELNRFGCFYRCHNSYLVNFDFIRAIQRDCVLLTDGKQLPVSRYRRKEMVKQYMEYVGGLL